MLYTILSKIIMSSSESLTFLPHSSSSKVIAVETTLQQTVKCFRDLVEEYDQMHIENVNYKSKYLLLKEKCESQCHSSSEALKKEIQQKNDVIRQIASALTKLLETKDLSVIDEIFSIICGTSVTEHNVSPKNELSSEENIIQDESVSEIDGTPGRKSPIIIMKKKARSNMTSSLSLNKKKSPDTCETPEKKTVKLVFPSPSRSKCNGRLKQSRLNIVKVKSSCVVDLTCSPETSLKAVVSDDIGLKLNVKRELIDHDETILPSPTSGSVNLPQMFKSFTKDSPNKFRKPQTPLKFKIEDDTRLDNEKCHSPTYTQHSIDLMKHCRKKLKVPPISEKQDENKQCDADESVSLLQPVRTPDSPQKQPLSDNINVVNIQDMESSLSILQNRMCSVTSGDRAKRVKLEDIEHVYKEPTVRKKSEKRALRGWSCDKCKQFYGELYADDQEMLAQKMDECSKHRGRNNPARPSTPTGFWEPRWDVPTDTEEFNRRNNAF